MFLLLTFERSFLFVELNVCVYDTKMPFVFQVKLYQMISTPSFILLQF